MVYSVACFYVFQNGGAPLLYAVHGNHVRCVEILLGEDTSLHIKASTTFLQRVLLKNWCLNVFQRAGLILPQSQILVSMQWTWLWLWVTGTVGVNTPVYKHLKHK